MMGFILTRRPKTERLMFTYKCRHSAYPDTHVSDKPIVAPSNALATKIDSVRNGYHGGWTLAQFGTERVGSGRAGGLGSEVSGSFGSTTGRSGADGARALDSLLTTSCM